MRHTSPKTADPGAVAAATQAEPRLAATADVMTTRQPIWRSRQLFAGNTELFIEHAGALYRLRITQANKLILTK